LKERTMAEWGGSNVEREGSMGPNERLLVGNKKLKLTI